MMFNKYHRKPIKNINKYWWYIISDLNGASDSNSKLLMGISFTINYPFHFTYKNFSGNVTLKSLAKSLNSSI